MKDPSVFQLLFLVLLIGGSYLTSAEVEPEPFYDMTAYTECQDLPEEPLYDGGILKNQQPVYQWVTGSNGNRLQLPVFNLKNLTATTIIYYTFSSWVRIHDIDSAPVRVSLVTQTTTQNCIGTVIAKKGCWSFLKGGFVLTSPSNASMLYFQSSDGKNVKMEVASASLQPFHKNTWIQQQEDVINLERKGKVALHVSNSKGVKLQGVNITIKQVRKDFLIGAAIGKHIIGNLPYQKWFVQRFDATVFENELKWNAVEPRQGQINYTIADQMLEFVRANKLAVRGRSNIFWEDPRYIPKWVSKLSGSKLHSAVNSRVRSLLSRYSEEFLHWDVGNARFLDSYEQRSGPNATLRFYKTASESDLYARLVMNEFNVVETCSDVDSTVDTYISKIRKLQQSGVTIDGIGLEGHFTVPNPPLMKAILDKLDTLSLPIWLTEVDISRTFSKETQAVYLDQVLRESFSHPAVQGIILWTALSPKGCYQMCLTDDKFQNLPAGDVVDQVLKEWETGTLHCQTDKHGTCVFLGFLGEHEVTATLGKKTVTSTFSIIKGDDYKQVYVHL